MPRARITDRSMRYPAASTAKYEDEPNRPTVEEQIEKELIGLARAKYGLGEANDGLRSPAPSSSAP
jgi:hypothetical protein